jgi:transposase
MNHKNKTRHGGMERKPPPTGFYEICTQWQNGKISAIDAARKMDMKLDQFYYLAKRDGLRKTIVLRGPWISAWDRFPQVMEQWNRGDIKALEAAQRLGISIITFYKWARAHGVTVEARRKLRHKARTVQFEDIFVKWQAKELSTEQAAALFGVTTRRFQDWVKQRHPDAIERKNTEPPALFFQLYEQWKQGEIKAAAAARTLGVAPAKFYTWTSAQGSLFKERREQRTAQFEKIFAKWQAKELTTDQAAKAFGVSKGRFREWVKRLHPDEAPRTAQYKHPGYIKFPFYYTVYQQKKITLKQAAAQIGVSKTTFANWVRCSEAGGMKLDFAATEQALGMNQDKFFLWLESGAKNIPKSF